MDNLLKGGFFVGSLFGFLLQRGGVLRYDKQVGALRFQDMTIIKFMMSAIMVTMVIFQWLRSVGQAPLNIKTSGLGANVLGGLTFGAGWGILGYCPGTSLGAAGEGRWDAIIGILGMITGASLFSKVYPALKGLISWGGSGELTLPDVIKGNPWAIIGGFVAATLALFGLIEKAKL